MDKRIERAVEKLGIQPTDTVLEIGCGHGRAVELICKKLTSGKVIAIDRSQKMLVAARKRNSANVESGHAEFQLTDFIDYNPKGVKFDAILALRVGYIHRNANQATALISKWLKPNGRLVLEYDEPK